jgi:catechol 2,3-dioxygenase-like lactoylglutathione lyase family enzyme
MGLSAQTTVRIEKIATLDTFAVHLQRAPQTGEFRSLRDWRGFTRPSDGAIFGCKQAFFRTHSRVCPMLRAESTVPNSAVPAAPLPLRSLNHVAVASTQFEVSRAFYKDVLGFREVSRPAFSFRGAWLYNYGLMIHIIESETAAATTADAAISTRDNHLAFDTGDLDAAEQVLRAHGVPYRKNEIPDRNIRQIFFRDPDGNHIEIGTYPAAPPALI